MSAAIHSSRRRIEPVGRARARIGLTPLIDVIFILLIFFMLATRFDVWQTLDVNAGGAAQTETEAPPLHLTVQGPAIYELGGETLEADALAARLRTDLAAHPRPVYLEPAADVSFAALMDAAALARQSGATALSFVDTPPAGAGAGEGGSP